ESRGRGMFRGVACGLDGAASEIIKECFERGLVMETSGPNDEVFKFLAPLVIDQEGLEKGFAIIEESIQAVLDRKSTRLNSSHVFPTRRSSDLESRGRGMFRGVACGLDGAASEIIKECFERGLVMETSGPNDEVFKFLAPLVIDQEGLEKGFAIIEESIQAV